MVSLGDSFAWGASIEFEDAYPQRLERGLARRRGEPWEVLSLALPGMNTVDQAAQLADEGLGYAPDVVLLGFVLNDSEDAQAAETRRAEDWLRARQARPGLFDRSALFRLVRGRVGATLENRRRIAGYRSMYAADAPGWIASREALGRMGARASASGVPFVVAIFPLFGNPLDDGVSVRRGAPHDRAGRRRRGRARGGPAAGLPRAALGPAGGGRRRTTSTRTRSPTASPRRRC